MAGELGINETIKLILGALVVAAILLGAYMIFKNKILGFFNGLSIGVFLNLIR